MNRIIKRPLHVAALILFIASAAFAQATQLQIPQPTGPVNDYANKLSAATKQSLENLLLNFRNKTEIEVAVVTLPFEQMGGYPIEEYALEMFRRWGIGSGDKPAALLLVAIKEPNNEGRYSGSTRLEISRHLEGDIPDGLAGELIRRLRVDFQSGNFDKALTTGVQTILSTIAEKRGLSLEGVDASAAYRPTRRAPKRGISFSTIIFLIILGVIIISALSRFGRGGGRGGRGPGSDWWIAPIIWGGGGSGWGGNSSGWGGGSSDSGGGGSDWGGFGGGGDAGGGGASDSW